MRYLSLLALSALCIGLGVVSTSASASAPPGPGPAHGFLMAPAGAPADPGVTRPITYFSGGLNVWVNAHATDRGKIVFVAREAVKQLRRYGVRIHYKGIAKGRSAEKGTDGKLGVVQVNSLSGTDRPCRRLRQGKPGLGAQVSFSAVARYPGLREIESADVDLCPSVFHETKSTAVTLHEFGHVVGLGNVSTKYRGTIQIMQVTDLLPIRYQAGDRNGLRYVNYLSRSLARPVPVQGKIAPLRLRDGQVHVRGWAIAGRSHQPATVTLTVDGQRVRPTTYRTTARPDIARRLHVWNEKSGFRLDAAARRGRHVYCVYASGSSRVRLGCETLAFAVAPPASSTSSSQPAPSQSASSAPALPGARSGGSSGTNVGLIAGVAGGVVLLVLIVALLVYNRRRRPPPEAPPAPEPMQFWPTLPPDDRR